MAWREPGLPRPGLRKRFPFTRGQTAMSRRTQADRTPVTPDERLDFLPYAPAATSGPLGWSGLRAEHFQGNPDLEVNLPPLTHHLLLLYRRPPDRFGLRSDNLHR